MLFISFNAHTYVYAIGSFFRGSCVQLKLGVRPWVAPPLRTWMAYSVMLNQCSQYGYKLATISYLSSSLSGGFDPTQPVLV